MTAPDANAIVLVPAGSSNHRLTMARAAFLAGYKPVTRTSYLDGLNQWFGWCTAVQLDPLEATRAHIDLWGRWLEEERHLAPSTVQHRLCTLRSFYRYCEDEEIIDRSPAARIRLPKVSPDSTTHGMSRAEVTRFLIASERNPMQHAMVCLMALSGLRVSEVCSVNVEDLSFEFGHRTLTVLRKGGKTQTIPLSPKTGRAIDVTVNGRTEGPILVTQIGTRVTRFGARDTVARIGRRAQLPYRVHPHMLRHAFATTALDAGVPLHDVQDSMNHSDPRTTMRYNRHRHSLDRNATHLVTAFLSAG